MDGYFRNATGGKKAGKEDQRTGALAFLPFRLEKSKENQEAAADPEGRDRKEAAGKREALAGRL